MRPFLFTPLIILSKKLMKLIWQLLFVIISFIFTFFYCFNLFQKGFKEVYKALRQNKFTKIQKMRQRENKVTRARWTGMTLASGWTLFAPLNSISTLLSLLSAPVRAPFISSFFYSYMSHWVLMTTFVLLLLEAYRLVTLPENHLLLASLILPHLCN